MAAPTSGATLRRRALRLRCPVCGVGRLFMGWFAMPERCTGCAFRFEREPGYFLGSIYLNYAITAAVAIGLHFLLEAGLGMRLAVELAVVAPVATLVALAGFRHARALWLAFDLACDPPRSDEFAAPPHAGRV